MMTHAHHLGIQRKVHPPRTGQVEKDGWKLDKMPSSGSLHPPSAI